MFYRQICSKNFSLFTGKTSWSLFLEAVVLTCSIKKVFLKISQNSQENTCARGLRPATLFKKETLAQVFSCEFCEISKNISFYRTPLVAASIFYQKDTPTQALSCEYCEVFQNSYFEEHLRTTASVISIS